MAWLGAGWAFAIGFGSGTIRNPTSVTENIAWGAGTAVLTRPFVVRTIVRPIGTTLFRTAVADAAIMAKAAASTTTASILGAAAAGYVLGATATVSVSGVAEKHGLLGVREGNTESLVSFYTGGLAMADGTQARDRSKWYESDLPILNIPGDAWYIGKHYWGQL